MKLKNSEFSGVKVEHDEMTSLGVTALFQNFPVEGAINDHR